MIKMFKLFFEHFPIYPIFNDDRSVEYHVSNILI